MFMKVIILSMMLVIAISLSSALFYLLKNKASGLKMAKALGFRIGFSLALFILLVIAFTFGWIQPHNIV
ncbi:MAG: hypothetical protein LEGION0398_MBIBDBAK_00971 [Legionellaceae bacterium]